MKGIEQAEQQHQRQPERHAHQEMGQQRIEERCFWTHDAVPSADAKATHG